MKHLFLVAIAMLMIVVGADAQQSVIPGIVSTLGAQGDLTSRGVFDTSLHSGQSAWQGANMPLVSILDTVTHTAKTADSVQEKVITQVGFLGFQVDVRQVVHNATGADSTTVTFYGTKSGGNWQYPNGGWVQLQQTTIANQTGLQSFYYDVNGGEGNTWTNYMIVLKVGETYIGTSTSFKVWCIWR